MPRRQDGFSLLEAVIATGLMLVVTASVFQLMNPAQGSFAAEPEIADMQQRLRVGADTLSKDLLMAGAGAYLGTQVGALDYFFAPVLPFRQGAVSDDPVGTFATDRITLIYVPSTTAQTTLAAAVSGNSATPTLMLAAETGCPRNPATGLPYLGCGFEKDMSVLVFDDTGDYDMFTIASVTDANAQAVVKRPPGSANTSHPMGAKVIEAVSHTYYLKTDNVNTVYQLMRYDGANNNDVPVVDNVVGLTFEYFGEPQPPIVKNPNDAALNWKTTYGPKPAGGLANCIFDSAVPPVPLLAVLGSGNPGLVPLTAAMLTDGPWCPNAANAHRWDADLLRIRNVGVTLRVQSANASLRGPASALFTHGGTSVGGTKWVPDEEIRFSVSPRNVNLGR
jgi:hypothetical protein